MSGGIELFRTLDAEYAELIASFDDFNLLARLDSCACAAGFNSLNPPLCMQGPLPMYRHGALIS